MAKLAKFFIMLSFLECQAEPGTCDMLVTNWLVVLKGKASLTKAKVRRGYGYRLRWVIGVCCSEFSHLLQFNVR